MRPIKIRFWNTIDKSFVKCDWWNWNYTINEIFEDLEKYNLIPSESTLLLDKNWNEIYEGDILQYRSKKSEKSEVYYEEGCFKVYQESIKTSRSLAYHLQKYECEIEGNIYQNHEQI